MTKVPDDPADRQPQHGAADQVTGSAAAAAGAAATAAAALAAAGGADLHHGQRGTERLDTTGLVGAEADDTLATRTEFLDRKVSEACREVTGLDRHTISLLSSSKV
ncbi:hypothetical protein KBX21_10335 [Nocardiopsis sp. B62]|nr:hypothetical protein [Nocardiopsis sp. B62]